MDPRLLVGRWRLARLLVDRRAGQFGRVRGELVIEADADGLRWCEVGELRWNAATTSVQRTLLTRPGPSGWWMTFADERPFHPWQPGQQVRHDCGADVYLGIVDARVDRIRTWWEVTGPAKSQRIMTRFQRVH